MKVLGIDPSVQSTGYGIIRTNADDVYTVLTYGTVRPSRKLPFPDKINAIRMGIDDLIHAYQPDEIAIENLFYAQNVKTALTLGQVRGAILVSVASNRLSLFEYSALEIKKAVTGYGQADKTQVSIMVRKLLNIQDETMKTDASDALATAVCHLNTRIFQAKLV